MQKLADLQERANTLNRELEAARMTKPVQVKIEGWGGKRNIPKKELESFAKALNSASELRGSGLGFGLKINGPHVQINPKYLDKLEKVVKAQGKRMGKVQNGTGIVGIEWQGLGLKKP